METIRLLDGELSLEPDQGSPVTEPALLTADGRLLASGEDAAVGEFRFLRLADWSLLHIPNVTAIHPEIGG